MAEIAVVTGACGGLGSEICRHLAGRGLDVVLVDRTAAKSQAFADTLRSAYPARTFASYTVDLADRADVARLAAELVAAYPGIAYLFNNAGVLTESLQFSRYGTELHFEVNTLAPLALVDGLTPALEAARGTVLNTSAGLASNVKTLALDELVKPASFSKLFGPYARSKAALNVLTAALGRERAGRGVLVRAADPGPTRTVLTKGAGTPLWMRPFYPLLPGPAANAKKLVDVAMEPRWRGRTGIFVSGGKAVALAPALAQPAFQDDLLRACRERLKA